MIIPPNKDHHGPVMNTAATKLALWPTALALIACYGTLCLVSLLALAGIALPINEGLWAVAISAFYALAVAAIAPGYRVHKNHRPILLAAIGLAVILWVMFGTYHWLTELIAFATLIAATLWNRRLQKSS